MHEQLLQHRQHSRIIMASAAEPNGDARRRSTAAALCATARGDAADHAGQDQHGGDTRDAAFTPPFLILLISPPCTCVGMSSDRPRASSATSVAGPALPAAHVAPSPAAAPNANATPPFTVLLPTAVSAASAGAVYLGSFPSFASPTFSGLRAAVGPPPHPSVVPLSAAPSSQPTSAFTAPIRPSPSPPPGQLSPPSPEHSPLRAPPSVADVALCSARCDLCARSCEEFRSCGAHAARARRDHSVPADDTQSHVHARAPAHRARSTAGVRIS